MPILPHITFLYAPCRCGTRTMTGWASSSPLQLPLTLPAICGTCACRANLRGRPRPKPTTH